MVPTLGGNALGGVGRRNPRYGQNPSVKALHAAEVPTRWPFASGEWLRTLAGYQVQRVGGCRLGGVGFFNPFGEVKVDPPPFERRLARALAGCGVRFLSL